MNNSKSTKVLSLFLIGAIISNILPILSVVADNDPNLAIQEGGIYTWQMESFDADKYYEAYDGSTGGWVGFKSQITIEYILKDDYRWIVEIESIGYVNTPAVVGTEFIALTIPTHGENFSVGTYFIPKNAAEFLGQWNATTNYTVSELTVTYSNNFTNIDRVYVFRSDGILLSDTESYKGSVIIKTVLISATISSGYFFIFVSAFAFFSIIFIATKKIKRDSQK